MRAANLGNFMEVARRSKAKPARPLHLKRSVPSSDVESAHPGAPSRPGPSASSSSSVAAPFAAPQRGEVARACERLCGMPCNLRAAQDHAAQQNAAVDGAVLTAQEEAVQRDHGMAIHDSAVAAISVALTAATAREAAAARERREADAAMREVAAAREAHAAQEAVDKKEAEVKALEQALAQERARKESKMKDQAEALSREAIETAREKVAEEKAKIEAELRALEAEKAQLLQQFERGAACTHEEAGRRAAEAMAVAMEEAQRTIRRETPPGGSRVDTLRRFFDGDPACRMKIDLDAEDSRSSEGRGPTTRHRSKGKGKTPKKSTEVCREAPP